MSLSLESLCEVVSDLTELAEDRRSLQFDRLVVGSDLQRGSAWHTPWVPDYQIERVDELAAEELAHHLAAKIQTPFARTTHSSLTFEEVTALLASSTNWLRFGQRLLTVEAPLSMDVGDRWRVGRTSVI